MKRDDVKSDSENAQRMLSDGGLILWHDYRSMPGVWKGVNEFARQRGCTYLIRGTHLALYDPQRRHVTVRNYTSPDRNPTYLKQN